MTTVETAGAITMADQLPEIVQRDYFNQLQAVKLGPIAASEDEEEYRIGAAFYMEDYDVDSLEETMAKIHSAAMRQREWDFTRYAALATTDVCAIGHQYNMRRLAGGKTGLELGHLEYQEYAWRNNQRIRVCTRFLLHPSTGLLEQNSENLFAEVTLDKRRERRAVAASLDKLRKSSR